MSISVNIQTISILGCGWYGFAAAQQLQKSGFRVKGSSTSPEKLAKLSQAGIEPFKVIAEPEHLSYDPGFFNCDLLIVSIPPKRAAGEAALYPEKVKQIEQAINRHHVKRVLFISSTSVYGDNNMEVTEDVVPQPDTESGEAILAAENIIRENNSLSATILRFGGLIGPERSPARFFAGKKNIPNGRAPVNLIHLDDCVAVTLAIIEKNAFGYIFNACCIDHPTKMDFYKQAAIRSNFELPDFNPERIQWKIVSSKHLHSLLGYTIKTLDKN